MSSYALNPDFKRQEFLNKYWQQQPVLLPALFQDFDDPITAEELAGLACEEFIESRLINTGKDGNWALEQGPFDETMFQQLPSRDWTVLVQAVDQWSALVNALKTPFDFLPSWRIEDVMVSYAAPGGGVGPHFDFYDVFLIQGSGQRRWLVGDRCPADAALLANSEQKILQSFEAKQEFILNPGDVLYLPPQIAHWGTAVNESLCYSIGFRAPSVAEMLEGYSDSLIARSNPARRFTDSIDTLPLKPGAINPGSLQRALEDLTELIADESSFAKWFGCYVSNPKYPELVQPAEHPLELSALRSRLQQGASLVRHPCSRFAFLKYESELYFFADGGLHKLPSSALNAVSTLCELTTLYSREILIILKTDSMPELLLQLHNHGCLILE